MQMGVRNHVLYNLNEDSATPKRLIQGTISNGGGNCAFSVSWAAVWRERHLVTAITRGTPEAST